MHFKIIDPANRESFANVDIMKMEASKHRFTSTHFAGFVSMAVPSLDAQSFHYKKVTYNVLADPVRLKNTDLVQESIDRI